MNVAQLTRRVRAKNAGPYRLTIDCFCTDQASYDRLRETLGAQRVGAALGATAGTVTRYELPSLHVVKFSLPRPGGVQGGIGDRDQHGAQWALVIESLVLDD